MIFNNKFTLAVLLALGVLLAGCSHDAPVPPEEEQPDPMVTLRLAIDMGSRPDSRADAPDYFEAPEGDFENINTLRVIIVQGGAVAGADVEANKLVKTYASGAPISDNLEFKVTTGRKRIYLIANEGSLPVPPNQPYPNATQFLDSYLVNEDFEPGTFTNWIVSLPGSNPSSTRSLYSNIEGGVNGLPLTEYFDFSIGADKETLQYDETQTVHLFMTRAAAKATFTIEVDDQYKAMGANIEAVRLNGLNWQQWVFPRTTRYNPTKQVEITPGLPSGTITPVDRYVTAFEPTQRVNGVTGANVTLNLANPIEIKANTNQNVGPIYFPESMMPETLEDNPAAAFSVQVLIDGVWTTAKMLGMTDGSNIQTIGGAQAIARNNHLKIILTFTDPNTITATVQLVPYVSVVLNPNFGEPIDWPRP